MSSNGQLRLSSNYNYKRQHQCSCGRTITGPLAKASHRRACDGAYLTWQERRAVAGAPQVSADRVQIVSAETPE